MSSFVSVWVHEYILPSLCNDPLPLWFILMLEFAQIWSLEAPWLLFLCPLICVHFPLKPFLVQQDVPDSFCALAVLALESAIFPRSPGFLYYRMIFWMESVLLSIILYWHFDLTIPYISFNSLRNAWNWHKNKILVISMWQGLNRVRKACSVVLGAQRMF